MSSYHVEASAIIHASPAHVYDIISDYNEGHQAILPRRYFDEMVVKKGGVGAGTEIYVKMGVFGSVAEYDMVVSEPEPGRVLQEEDAKAGVTTTFTIDPVENGVHTRVTIATDGRVSDGLKGVIEKLLVPAVSRRIYREELANLERVATSARRVTGS